MNIQITNINMRYNEGVVESVQVYFNGNDEERTLNINGYVPLTAAEYAGNESVDALTVIVKNTVATKFTV